MKLGQFFDQLAGAKPPVKNSSTQKETADDTKTENSNKVRSDIFPFTRFVLVVVTIGASFLFGMAYQKSQDAKTTRILGTTGSGSASQNGSSTGGSSGMGGFGSGGGGYGQFGGSSVSAAQVTSVSDSSITVKDSSGNSDTYAITANTFISDGGQIVSSSDIQTGDTVIVIPDRMDPTSARRIIVNPSSSSSQPSIDPGETQIN